MTNWYYIDGPKRVGPFTQEEWDDLTRSGKITASTLVWHENLTRWTPYGELLKQEESPREEEETFPARTEPVWTPGDAAEDSAEEGPVPLENALPPFDDPAVQPEAVAAALRERDYEIPVWRTVKSGVALLSRHPWFLISNTALAHFVRYFPIPGWEFLYTFVLGGVLTGGLSSVYLRALRGQRPIFLDLFSGFRRGYFRNLAMKTFISGCVTIAGLIPSLIALALLGLTGPEASWANLWANLDNETLLVLLLAISAGALPSLYFLFCWGYAEALIRDKRLPYSIAMRLSREKVLQHPWKIGWVMGLGFVVASLPTLLFIAVGMLFMRPFTAEGFNQLLGVAFLVGLIGLPMYEGVFYSIYELIFNSGGTAERQQPAGPTHAHHG